jgi:aminopeptidase N
LSEQSNLTRDEARDRAQLVSDVHYDITLDLTGPESFESDAVVRFHCQSAGVTTFLDLTASDVTSIEVNGSPVDPSALTGHRVLLTDLREENEVRVVARCTYHRTELGMHRFDDPVDGNVYLHTDFEPFDAHRVFACFDQPDIKATFVWNVIGEKGWEVAANSRATGDPVPENGHLRWSFERTAPIPTYISCVCAGPWHVVRDRHRDLDLGLYCRQSLAQYLDPAELFEITKQGFDFFENAYAYPFPFGTKYDQVFVPESNSGAMENAAIVTFNDLYVFRSRVTDAARERRAETILHEMAHMWFGDLVTMRWWDDLWLNESFASYMAVLSQSEATRWNEAWTTFADTEKTWAYRQDQLPTTHPIVADIPDVNSIHLNFDGITYAKGASVLRQLVAWVGADQFMEGMRRYHKRHEYGNAELADFLADLEDASDRDLHAWSKEWLETAGANTLRPRFETDGRSFTSFAVLQEAAEKWPTLRSHRIAVGLFDAGEDGISRRTRVELDVVGERTEVPELLGQRIPDLVLVNDGDLTFAKIRLDERSLATAIDRMGDLHDSLARTLCWTACWDMTRDAEMRARDYVRLVVGNIDRESKISVVQSLLGQAASAINVYGDPANRDAAGQALAEAALEHLQGAEPGSDWQLVWARSFISNARSKDHLDLIRGLLDGLAGFEGLVVDTEFRWHIVKSLAADGAIDDDVIGAEYRRDPTDRGSRHAAAARAARPSETAKAEAWRLIVEDSSQPLALVEEVMAGFHQFGQEVLLAPFVERFFEDLPAVWASRDLPEALEFGRGMYPHLIIEEPTVARTDEYLARPDVPGPVRRLLLEGKDGVLRAMRARAVDAGSAS